MWVVSPKIFRSFARIHPKASAPIEAWYARARKAKWASFTDVRKDFAQADQYGPFVIFDIGGNKYRLIAAIHYNTRKLFVRHVLTHAEYDSDKWKEE
jgi:mRNA interferase HigB